jgi:hypothetical protein
VGVGQFNAQVQCDVAPDKAGALRDRLKQLGVLARLDVNRTQEQQGGTGRPQDAKIQQNDTQLTISIYNLAATAPRETVNLVLASADAEKSYRAILASVERVGGRIVSSQLSRLKNYHVAGHLNFQVKAADADGVLADARAAGEVLRLEVQESADLPNSTRSKKGFNLNISGFDSVQPRETATIVLASRDVPAGYRALLEAAKAVDGRLLGALLHENDRQNMTATLSLELRRDREKELADALPKAGEVYTRNSSRAQDSDTVTDSKVLLNLRLFDAANIPARETVRMGLEVGDVDAAAKAVEAAFRGRIADTRHSRAATGQRESVLSIDVPLAELPAAIERIKAAGNVLDQTETRNTDVPDNALAVGRLEVRLSNEVLVAHTSGPWANVKRGLGISLQAASWSLMLIMIGVCFVLPLLLAVWTAVKIHRKLRPKPVAAA